MARGLRSFIVAIWAKGLIDEISKVMSQRGAASQAPIADLHVWRVGRTP